MLRPMAVLLVAATLVSCRSSQPTTNPFMRTTVAPPATTPGVIVTPGQPYAQGISPPMITSPAPPPVTVAPVAPQQVAPVMPPPVAPVAAPAPMQNGAKFHPPGGDYLFHQSSNEPPAAKAHTEQTHLTFAAQPETASPPGATQPYTVVTACYAPPADEPRPVPMQADGTVINPYVKSKSEPSRYGLPVTPQADGTILNPFVKAKPAVPKLLPRTTAQQLPPAAEPIPLTGSESPAKALPIVKSQPIAKPQTVVKSPPRAKPAPLSASRSAPASTQAAAKTSDRPARVPAKPRLTFAAPVEEPQPDLTAIRVGKPSQTSTLRILGESSSSNPVAAKMKSPAPGTTRVAGEPTVLRITAVESKPSLRSTVHSEPASAPADLALSTSRTEKSSASLVAPKAEPAVVRASFEPPAGKAVLSGDYAHTADYQTLRGKLEYSASLRQWKLRYIPISGRTDAYGGSVILPDSPALARFKSGELVEIRGTLAPVRIRSGGFAPQYAPASIERLAR